MWYRLISSLLQQNYAAYELDFYLNAITLIVAMVSLTLPLDQDDVHASTSWVTLLRLPSSNLQAESIYTLPWNILNIVAIIAYTDWLTMVWDICVFECKITLLYLHLCLGNLLFPDRRKDQFLCGCV